MPVQESVTQENVEKIKKYLREQIWQQVNNEQYEAIVEELKKQL